MSYQRLKSLVVYFFVFLIAVVPFAESAGGGGGGSTKTTPSCTEDIWSCGFWSKCQKDGTQTRTCTLSYDCPSADTKKPAEVESCNYISNMIASLKCHNLGTIKERVACRLGLTDADLRNELEIAYLPEECRALNNDADKEDCVMIYSKSQQCWTLPIKKRSNCLKQIFDIKDLKNERVSCKNPSCFATIKKKAYMLIKFKFYDLEERAEMLYDNKLITKEQAADIIAKLEENKIAFNGAKTKEERKQIILETKKLWNNFIFEVKK